MGYPTINELIATFEGFGTPNAPTITAANNPGAITDGPWARANGSVGGSNGFAVFPDLAAGWTALDRLVTQKVNQGATPFSLIQGGNGLLGWAPPRAAGNSQQSADAYSAFIANGAGLGLHDPIAPNTPSTPTSMIAPDSLLNRANPVLGAGKAAVSSALWFLNLSLTQIVFIVLGFVLIIAGLFFLRSVQSGIVTVQRHGRRAAEVISTLGE